MGASPGWQPLILPVTSEHIDVQIEDVPVHPGLHVDEIPQVVLGAVKLRE